MHGPYIGYITPTRRFSVATKPQRGCSVTGLYQRMRGETHTLLNRTPYTPKPHPYTPEPHPYTPEPHSATILRRHTLLAAPLISSASVVQSQLNKTSLKEREGEGGYLGQLHKQDTLPYLSTSLPLL